MATPSEASSRSGTRVYCVEMLVPSQAPRASLQCPINLPIPLYIQPPLGSPYRITNDTSVVPQIVYVVRTYSFRLTLDEGGWILLIKMSVDM